ncbi:MAG: hypothetical protein PHS54_00015 [Clostridia bacterium]|nr:hypothetical protein [Clostridia bacterium]
MIYEHILGPLTGTVRMKGTTKYIPSKFLVGIDDIIKLDTGYRGSISYQTELTNFLTSNSLPDEEIISATWNNDINYYPGNFDLTLFKNDTTEMAYVTVYSPLDNNDWCYTLFCPDSSCNIVTELSTTCVSTSCDETLYEMTSTFSRLVYIANYNNVSNYTINSAFDTWIPLSAECHPPTITTVLSTSAICPFGYTGGASISCSVSTTYCTLSTLYGSWEVYDTLCVENTCVPIDYSFYAPSGPQYSIITDLLYNITSYTTGALRISGTTFEIPVKFIFEVSSLSGSAFYDTGYMGNPIYTNALNNILQIYPLYGTYPQTIINTYTDTNKYGNFDFPVLLLSSTDVIRVTAFHPLGNANALTSPVFNVYCPCSADILANEMDTFCIGTSCDNDTTYQMTSTYIRDIYSTSYETSTFYTICSCYSPWIPVSGECHPPEALSTVYSSVCVNTPCPLGSDYYMMSTYIAYTSALYCTQEIITGNWISLSSECFIKTIPCGQNYEYSGDECWPNKEGYFNSITAHNIGTSFGSILLSGRAYQIPDRIVVGIDNTIVCDTKWVGLPTNELSLNNKINTFNITDPSDINYGYQEVIAGRTSTGAKDSANTHYFSINFKKNMVTSTAYVSVYAPLGGTVWDYKLHCPEIIDCTSHRRLQNTKYAYDIFPTPNVFAYNLGTSTGTVRISGSTFNTPNRIVIGIDNDILFDTGYLGNVGYQTSLTNILTSRGVANATISAPGHVLTTQGMYAGNFNTSFIKNTTSQYAYISVFNPYIDVNINTEYEAADWWFDMGCPD